jgi:hypothetical protein
VSCKTIIVISAHTPNGQPGEVVKVVDVSGKLASFQEKLFDAYVGNTDLTRFDVTMYCPENKPGFRAEDFFALHPELSPTA